MAQTFRGPAALAALAKADSSPFERRAARSRSSTLTVCSFSHRASAVTAAQAAAILSRARPAATAVMPVTAAAERRRPMSRADRSPARPAPPQQSTATVTAASAAPVAQPLHLAPSERAAMAPEGSVGSPSPTAMAQPDQPHWASLRFVPRESSLSTRPTVRSASSTRLAVLRLTIPPLARSR